MPEKKWTYQIVRDLYKTFMPDDVDGEGNCVIVAEDQASMRTVICKALEQKNFVAIPALDGLEALRKIREHNPNCCILDLGLPSLSGLEVLEAIRRDDSFSQLPVLICTARKEKNDIIYAHRLGVSGYIVKPFEMVSLLKRVGDACGVGENEDDAEAIAGD